MCENKSPPPAEPSADRPDAPFKAGQKVARNTSPYCKATVLSCVFDDGWWYVTVRWEPKGAIGVLQAYQLSARDEIEPGDVVQERGTSKAAYSSPAQEVLALHGEWAWVKPCSAKGNPWTVRVADVRIMRKGPA
jgi:hypothetical protein